MVVRKKNDIKTVVELDNLRAENAKLKADLDYLSMMADVELDEEREPKEAEDEREV